jgi:cardiolipin synthase
VLIRNLPNALTVLRLLAVPVLAWALLSGRYLTAFWLFVGAALTDALDGFLARRFDSLTPLGAIMDPLADKLITLVCILLLTWLGIVPFWLTLALVVRDTLIVGGAFAYHRVFGEVEIRPTRLGKLHTLAAFLLITALLAEAAEIWQIGDWRPEFFFLVLATTVASGTQYVVAWGRKAAEQARLR